MQCGCDVATSRDVQIHWDLPGFHVTCHAMNSTVFIALRKHVFVMTAQMRWPEFLYGNVGAYMLYVVHAVLLCAMVAWLAGLLDCMVLIS